jgi:hypothetical protein
MGRNREKQVGLNNPLEIGYKFSCLLRGGSQWAFAGGIGGQILIVRAFQIIRRRSVSNKISLTGIKHFEFSELTITFAVRILKGK